MVNDDNQTSEGCSSYSIISNAFCNSVVSSSSRIYVSTKEIDC